VAYFVNMIEPVQLRITELQALLELREDELRRFEDAAAEYQDPRTLAQCQTSLAPLIAEVSNLRQELAALKAGNDAPANYRTARAVTATSRSGSKS
jgi:hypothetical protein